MHPRFVVKATKVLLASFGLGFVLISGCDDTSWKNRKPGVYVEEEKERNIYDLKPSDVVIRLNGRKITKRDFTAMQSMYAAVASMRWGIPLGTPSDRVRKFVKNREQKTPEELFRRELFRQEADRLHITVDSSMRSNAFERVRRNLKRPKAASPAVIAAEIGGDAGKMFLTCFESDIRDEALRMFVTTNWAYAVSDEDVARRMQEVKDFNARADASNEIQRAKANLIRKRAIAGENMAALSKECSQVSPGFGEKWQTVEVGEFPPDDVLRKWLDTDPKEGDVSEPIDLDDGLAIIKVAKRTKRLVDEESKAFVIEYTLVRVTLFAYEYFAVEDAEKTRQTLIQEKRGKAQEETFKRLYAEAVIEFPNGNKLFKQPKEKNKR